MSVPHDEALVACQKDRQRLQNCQVLQNSGR